jgi:predicted nucleic acid-binding protein
VLACDASLAVELSLDRVGEEAVTALGNGELIAPPLLWSEVPSVLHELAFRGEISHELGEQALTRFLGAKLEILAVYARRGGSLRL